MTFLEAATRPDPRLQWIVPGAVVLGAMTLAVYGAPLPAGSLAYLSELLLLAAFALPLWPLTLARKNSDHSVAWLLLLASVAAGFVGQLLRIAYRLAVGPPAGVAAAELGVIAFMGLATLALALEVSADGPRPLRAELVVDLLLIGTIGLLLAQELFTLLPVSRTAVPSQLALSGVNLIAALALGVAALGALISGAALGGGIPRLLVGFSAFIAAVSRAIFAYRSFFGLDTTWLTPVWILALLLIAAAATQRATSAAAASRPAAGGNGALRTLVVPMIVAYGLSLLIREVLGASTNTRADGMAWAALALLIVARVATAIFSSERHAAALSAWERRYEALVETMGSLVYEWDPGSGRTLRIGAVEQVFGPDGARANEAVESTFERMHPDDRAGAERAFFEAVRRGGLFEIEYRLPVEASGWRLIRDRGLCEHDEHGNPRRVLGIMTDVTDERRKEERLRQAEKLASLGGLAAGAAHEINNPLAAISLAAQMLMEDNRLPEDVLDDVRVIERQASRAGEVTDRMLVFARRREGERAAYDINDLLGEVLRSRRYEIDTRAISLQQDLGSNLPPVWVDPVQIERVLTNLIINAEKALAEMPDGKRLLLVSTRATEAGVAVDVADTGAGIPEEVLPRIFDPFFTTRDVGQGTGLGLSMSHSIVEAHGGELRVQTAAGEGTTFTMELPRAPQDAAELEPGAGTGLPDFVVPEARPGQSLDVLIIDDEKEIRDLCRRFLSGKGHRVSEAATGREALDLVTANLYDAIVLDLRMPDMSGEGFFEWLREHRPQMASRVTIISGDFANPHTAATLERIGRPYLMKPFQSRQLLDHVEGVAAPREGPRNP